MTLPFLSLQLYGGRPEVLSGSILKLRFWVIGFEGECDDNLTKFISKEMMSRWCHNYVAGEILEVHLGPVVPGYFPASFTTLDTRLGWFLVDANQWGRRALYGGSVCSWN